MRQSDLYAGNVDVASAPEVRAKLHPRPDFSTNVAGSLSGSISQWPQLPPRNARIDSRVAEFRCYPILEPLAIMVTPKKRGRGRPATGRDPIVTLRLPVDIRREIERLAAKEGVSRSEMFRMLLEQAMKRRPR